MDTRILVRKCLEGNREAWEMLVRKYSNKIFNLSFQFCGIYQEAEDLTQEIFLKLYKRLHQYSFKKNFDAWLFTLAKNHCIDYYRKRKQEIYLKDEFKESKIKSHNKTSPEFKFFKKERVKLVWEGLNKLSEDIKIAVILRDIQEMSYEEISEYLEIPIGTVKSRINRGRIQLAKHLIEMEKK